MATAPESDPIDNSDEKGLIGGLISKVSGIAQRQIGRVEAHVLGGLRARMDRLDAPDAPLALTYLTSDGATAPTPPSGSRRRSLSDRMAKLMERAEAQNRDAAQEEVFHQVLNELVSDEVRILGVLADGSSHALIHAGYAPRVGQMTRRVVENFSAIGKPAGVKLPEYVPSYITHLRAMGVVDTGPEDPKQNGKYQALEHDVTIRQALEAEQKGAGMSAKYLRRTLYMTDFGRQFWRACTAKA